MPERIYNGPHAEVEVFLPDGTTIKVARGQAADFSPEAAASLDEQGDSWADLTAKDTLSTGPAKPTVEAPKLESQTTADGGKE